MLAGMTPHHSPVPAVADIRASSLYQRIGRFDRLGTLIEEHCFASADGARDFAVSKLANIPGHRAIVCDVAAGDKVLWDSTP